MSLKSMGFWASCPWIALMAMVFLAGFVSDKIANGSHSEMQYKMRTVTAMAVTVRLSACTSHLIRPTRL